MYSLRCFDIKNPKRYLPETPLENLLDLNDNFLNGKNLFEYVCLSLKNRYYLLSETQPRYFYHHDHKIRLLEHLIDKCQIPSINFNYYQRNFLYVMANNLCFYTDVSLVKKMAQKYPEVFHKEIDFPYECYPKYNLLTAAISNNKFEIVEYLVKEHHHSFYLNFKYFNMPKLSKNFKSRLQSILFKDNIVPYLDFDDSDIHKYIIFFEDINLVKIILKQIVDYGENGSSICPNHLPNLEKYERKNKFLLSIFKYYLDVENVKVIKYILNHPYYLCEFQRFNVHQWVNMFHDHVNYNQSGTNSRKNIISYEILKFIKSNTLIWDDVTKCLMRNDNYSYNYQYIFFNNSIKYPNFDLIYDILEKPNYYPLFYDISLITNLFRYGTYPTFQYLLKNMTDLEKNLRDFDNIKYLVTDSLCNSDRRIFEKYKEILEKENPNSIINLIDEGVILFKFLRLPTLSDNLKMKKLKYLYKYYGESPRFRTTVLEVMEPLQLNHEVSEKLQIFIMKKIFQDHFSTENVNVIDLNYYFEYILQNYNFDFVKYFLKRIDKKWNFYQLVIKALLNKHDWFGYVVQEILKYTSDLKLESGETKKAIFSSFVYGDKNTEQYSKYLVLLKYFQESGFNLDININFNYYIQEHILVKCIKNNSSKLFKALIYTGCNFKPVIDYYIQNPHIFDTVDSWYWYPDEVNKVLFFIRWVKLYYLIKSLEFRVTYRKRRNHQAIFHDTVINMTSRVPQTKPVLQKAGPLYYQDLDQLDCLYEVNSQPFVKAVHLEPLELLQILPDMCLSQKVDGVLHQDVKLDELYPYLKKETYHTYDSEYLEGYQIHFVFNTRSHQSSQTTFLEDYLNLRSEHPIASKIPLADTIFTPSDTRESIYRKLDRETESMMKFIKNYHQINTKWWPKTVYQLLVDELKKVEILEIIQEYQKNIFDKLDHDFSKYRAEQKIPMDGIIIMKNSDKQRIWKLKDFHYLTADLKVTDRIMRCYWHRDNREWIPKEERPDKNFPNPVEVVKKLERLHLNPWYLSDLKKYVQESDAYYYQKHTVYHTNLRRYIDTCKKLTKEVLGNEVLRSIKVSDKILDLGCGHANNILWKNSQTQIDGLEIDFKLMRPPSKYKKIYHQNISQPWNQDPSNSITHFYQGQYSTSRMSPTKYQYITSLLSFQNVLSVPEGIPNLFAEINPRVNRNSKFIISFLDRDRLFQKSSKYTYPDGSYVNLTSLDEIKYYYAWRHYHPRSEKILSHHSLKKLMREQKWELTNTFRIPESDINNPYHNLMDCFTICIFTPMVDFYP